MAKYILAGQEYEVENFTARQAQLAESLKALNDRIIEAQRMISVLQRAKSGYMEDLKSEILAAKAGFDFDL